MECLGTPSIRQRLHHRPEVLALEILLRALWAAAGGSPPHAGCGTVGRGADGAGWLGERCVVPPHVVAREGARAMASSARQLRANAGPVPWSGVRGWIRLALLLAVTGCGRPAPYQVVPVSGKVTYADGSAVSATEVRVAFVPQDVAPAGGAHPPMASGVVRADGTFRELTTYSFGDGAIVGQHRVTVVALDPLERPLDAVAAHYRSEETTPLTANVARGSRTFEFVVEREP